MKAAGGAESQSAVHGIFISNNLNGTQTDPGYYFIRGQENGSYTVRYCMYFRGGVNGVSYFAPSSYSVFLGTSSLSSKGGAYAENFISATPTGTSVRGIVSVLVSTI